MKRPNVVWEVECDEGTYGSREEVFIVLAGDDPADAIEKSRPLIKSMSNRRGKVPIFIQSVTRTGEVDSF